MANAVEMQLGPAAAGWKNKPWLLGESMRKPTEAADASWALLAARQLPTAKAMNLS